MKVILDFKMVGAKTLVTIYFQTHFTPVYIETNFHGEQEIDTRGYCCALKSNDSILK